MNKVIICGRLAQDPILCFTKTGKCITNFSVAVGRWVNAEEQTDFIPVVTWDKLAETCGNNLDKGQRVLVEGRLQIKKYEIEGGEKRKSAEVVAERVEFLDKAKTCTVVEADLKEFKEE